MSTEVFAYLALAILVIGLAAYMLDRMPSFEENNQVRSGIDQLQDVVNLACSFDQFHTTLLFHVPASTLEVRGQEVCIDPPSSPFLCRLVVCPAMRNTTLNLAANSYINVTRNETGYVITESTG